MHKPYAVKRTPRNIAGVQANRLTGVVPQILKRDSCIRVTGAGKEYIFC